MQRIKFATAADDEVALEDIREIGLAADAACWLGHTKDVLKHDNQPAMNALRIRSLEIRSPTAAWRSE